MLGYLGIPRDETLDDHGFYRTGDAGWLDPDGWLHFQGRLTTVIKTGGANVSPLEIAAVLERAAGVKAACVVGVPHPTLGEMVVACIVPADGAVLDSDELRAYARLHLASYKVPRRVLFLREDEVALTASAKIKPGELRALAQERLKEATKEGRLGEAKPLPPNPPAIL